MSSVAKSMASAIETSDCTLVPVLETLVRFPHRVLLGIDLWAASGSSGLKHGSFTMLSCIIGISLQGTIANLTWLDTVQFLMLVNRSMLFKPRSGALTSKLAQASGHRSCSMAIIAIPGFDHVLLAAVTPSYATSLQYASGTVLDLLLGLAASDAQAIWGSVSAFATVKSLLLKPATIERNAKSLNFIMVLTIITNCPNTLIYLGPACPGVSSITAYDIMRVCSGLPTTKPIVCPYDLQSVCVAAAELLPIIVLGQGPIPNLFRGYPLDPSGSYRLFLAPLRIQTQRTISCVISAVGEGLLKEQQVVATPRPGKSVIHPPDGMYSGYLAKETKSCGV
ncbi:hypothetical protein Tco_1165646 [Tanacetum coccineum]